jgi:hypothetical protein
LIQDRVIDAEVEAEFMHDPIAVEASLAIPLRSIASRLSRPLFLQSLTATLRGIFCPAFSSG